MKQSIRGIIGLLAIVSLTLVPAQLRAQDVVIPLTIQLTAIVQGADDGGEPIDHVKTTTVKWTTQTVLKLAAAALGTTFPTGARLVSSNDTFLVLSKTGTVLADLTAAGLMTVDYGTDVVSGQSNSNTGQASWVDNGIVYLTFDDNSGNAFYIEGLDKLTLTDTAVDRKGNQKETMSISVTGVGEGGVGGTDAVFSGTIKGSGSVTFTP